MAAGNCRATRPASSEPDQQATAQRGGSQGGYVQGQPAEPPGLQKAHGCTAQQAAAFWVVCGGEEEQLMVLCN